MCPWVVSVRSGAGVGPGAGGGVHPSPSPSPDYFLPPTRGGTLEGVFCVRSSTSSSFRPRPRDFPPPAGGGTHEGEVRVRSSTSNSIRLSPHDSVEGAVNPPPRGVVLGQALVSSRDSVKSALWIPSGMYASMALLDSVRIS